MLLSIARAVLQHHNTDADFYVSQTDFDKGHAMYRFNMATDHDPVFEVFKRGSVHTYLRFDVAFVHMLLLEILTSNSGFLTMT